jgi:hypothetical protein
VGSALFLVPPIARFLQSIIPGFGNAGPFTYVLMGVGTLMYLIVLGYLVQLVRQLFQAEDAKYHGMTAIVSGLKAAVVLIIYYIPYSLLNVLFNSSTPLVIYTVLFALLFPAVMLKLATKRNLLHAFNIPGMFHLFSVKYLITVGLMIASFVGYSLISYGVGLGVLAVFAGNVVGAGVYYLQYVFFIIVISTTIASVITYAADRDTTVHKARKKNVKKKRK